MMMEVRTRLVAVALVATSLVLACDAPRIGGALSDALPPPAAGGTGDAPADPRDDDDDATGTPVAPSDDDETSGDDETSASTGDDYVPPECGNGVVEDGEECDANAGDACDLDGFACRWRRWMFLSSERRDGWAWRADLEGADAACQSEAAAAGLPVAETYRAFAPQSIVPALGPYDAWQWTGARYRNTCTGDVVPGTDDPYSDPFNLLEQLHLGAVEVEDWPTCNAAGEPTPAPDLQIDKDPAPSYLAAWWSFSDAGRVLVPDSGGCYPGDASGVVGFVGGGDKWHPHDGAVAGLDRPCGIALPLLCVAAIPK